MHPAHVGKRKATYIVMYYSTCVAWGHNTGVEYSAVEPQSNTGCYLPPSPGRRHKAMMRVWRLPVAYSGPKSRTEWPRKTKIGTEVAPVTRDSDITFKVKRSKVNLQGAEAYYGGLPHSLFRMQWKGDEGCGLQKWKSPRRVQRHGGDWGRSPPQNMYYL